MKIVPDTNLFVAASFNPRSSSAKILKGIEDGRLDLVWHARTRSEVERMLRRIPRTSWERFRDFFKEANEYRGKLRDEDYLFVEDPEDRKYAALGETTGSVIVTNDSDLLENRGWLGVEVTRPGEFVRRYKF